jgi:Ca2+-binding EF-hand superfamily protein
VLVSYSLNLKQWLDEQRKVLKSSVDWKRFLLQKAGEVAEMLGELDQSGDHTVDRNELRKGLAAMGFEIEEKEVSQTTARVRVLSCG